MDRDQKRAFVTSFREVLKAQELVVVTQSLGLTVAESEKLRGNMREAGASFKIVKNSLARLCVKDTPCESVLDLLVGPTALAYSQCPVAAAKVAVQFANGNEKIRVVGGVLKGRFLSAQEVEQLAKLPSLEELRGKILAVLVASPTKIARTVREPASQFVRLLLAHSQKS
ncbi:MAG: 50S ribosomal protein L10 [Alphaproteobacteria bacterium]